mmetsp:Transcript_9789/g.16056  ORF Transcript_9789/g.16056 Transcript_9789/m.16056 type:complete len:121 (+) Transcript_9789:104-466(+)
MPDRDVAELQSSAHAVVPTELNKLRACLSCSLVKNADQFLKHGCENCAFFGEKRKDYLNDCTSVSFDGLISLMHPTESWVARWQRIQKLVPGCYAIKVRGELPDYVRENLEDMNYSRRRT